MQNILVLLCVVFPVLAALAVLAAPGYGARRAIVCVTGVVLAVASIALAYHGPFTMTPDSFLGLNVNGLITVLDFLLLLYVLYLSFRMRNALIGVLTLAQLIGLAYLDFFMQHTAPAVPAIQADSLSLLMVLIISIVGSLICVYALGYMREHEEHLQLTRSKQPRFFCLMLLFLGVMNGLVLVNNLQWLYFFWEVTSVCSFALIAHDQTKIAVENAKRALWMNMLGGLAFVIAMFLMTRQGMSLSVSELLNTGMAGYRAPFLLLPVGLLCFAGFVKAAQIPFQSWLCGAMVAPTPVSALLHSSTMVKAGVYLIIRLAPAYGHSGLSVMIALFGGFTFLAASALAVGQSNGKKILAYSTIANLGLIIACAGINSPWSMSAAIMLIIFHSVSKALLFLCMGTVEQKIGSRNIEDMRGLYAIMPRTTIIMVTGIISMFLPPFGMLLSKWMAIESASAAGAIMGPMVLMLALGSALTVLFWARWAGMLLGRARPGLNPAPEQQDGFVRATLTVLGLAAAVLSFLAPVVYAVFVRPMLAVPYLVEKGMFTNRMGVFAVYPIFIILALGAWWAWRKAKRASLDQPLALPYMSGIQVVNEDGTVGFLGPMNTPTKATTANYYLENLFGESRLTGICNAAALVLLAVTLALITGGLH